MLGNLAMRGWGIACAALLFGTALALVALLLVLSPVRAQGVVDCESRPKPQVPGAVK